MNVIDSNMIEHDVIRKPVPTFRHHALERLARTLGRWRPAPPAGPIVAVCHCHHPDLVPELCAALGRLPDDTPIHVTSSRPEVFERWRECDVRPAATAFHDTENRGRDLRPFFEVARRLDLSAETLVLKLHGKRSAYSAQGERWRRALIGGLLPDRRSPRWVAARFRADTRLGMLGAPGSFLSHPVYWGEDRAIVARIMLQAFGMLPAEEDLGFYAGSMFWIRADLLATLVPLVDLDAFEPEPLAKDGTYAHALERLLPMAARRMGWRLGEIGRAGAIHPAAVRNRKIPYL